MGFELTREQAAAVRDRGGALLVSAAAGSGKTRVLVERLMDYVAKGHDINEFLVITFTNAAAAELRGRIAKELGERLAADPSNGHLRRQTTLVYQASICTIDAFCIDFLRECGHLAGVDPDFRICDEAEGAAKRAAALERVLEARYADIGNDTGFQELAEALAGDRDDQTLADVVEDVYRRVQSHPDPARWLRERREDFHLPETARPEDTPWGALLLEDGAQLAEYWADVLSEVRDEAALDEALEHNYGLGLERTVEDLNELAAACRTGWDNAAACQVRFPAAGRKKGGDEALKERIKDLRNRCKKQLAVLDERFAVSGTDAMDDLRALYPAMSALLAVVEEFDAAYRAEKTERLLDFSDAEHRTVALLTDGAGQPTELALEWRQRYTEIMVDEYQDTNEVQNVLFRALSRDETNLFLVGDVKQSIYRFRLADPTIFLEKYARYVPAEAARAGEARKQVLSQNFRSRPEVLDGVNFIFRNIMSRQLGELDYTAAEALYPGRTDLTYDPRFQMELDAVDLSNLTEPEEGGKTAKDLVEARAAARRIRDLYDSRFPVGEGAGARPVDWGDMAVLLRSPGPVLGHYAKAFGELGIPWTADGGEEFFDTTEVHVALAYLQIVDNPHQDVPLLAVLRSPVWNFSADRLAQIRAGGAERDFYSALLAAEARGEADCGAFLTDLRALRAQAGEQNSHQFLWALYERTGMLGIFGAMPDGARRRENLLAFYDCARSFEAGGHRGLFGFLTHVARMVENGVSLGSVGQEGSGVKLMSIHRSKGLEFPVVLVCGLDRMFNDSDLRATILFHTRLGLGPKRTDRRRMLRYTTIARDAVALALRREARAEEMRLLYVAMTRAEQKLILVTALNGRLDKLTPLVRQAQCPVHPQTLSACRAAAGWVLLPVLCRPDAGALHDLAGEAPAQLNGHSEYPWDIRVADGAQFERPPAAPAAEADPEAAPCVQADPALLERFSWQYPHQAQVDMPSKLTATQLKGREKDEEAAENTERSGQTAARPLSRPRFAAEERGLTPAQKGSALHLVMEQVALDRADHVDGVRAEIARLVAGRWLTPQQGETVDPAWIAAFWSSELGRAGRSADRLEREFKFSLLVPAKDYFPQAEAGEEVLLQGVVDCWFQTADGAVTVVDFKTDAVTEATVEARAAEYAPQLEAYSRALGEVLGRPVARRALWFFRLGRAVEL